MILHLKRDHVNLLREETRRVYPIEACALLFGHFTEENFLVEKVVLTPNILHSTTRFTINPETVVKEFNQAEIEGLDLIGLFHSHPAPAKPSVIDLKFMNLWEDAVWLILSSTNYNLVAYQKKNGELRKITIQIEDETVTSLERR